MVYECPHSGACARSPFDLASATREDWSTRPGRWPNIYQHRAEKKMSAISNYPLMDTLNSAMFRLSMEDLVLTIRFTEAKEPEKHVKVNESAV